MKHVLIIIESQLLREYISLKLEENGIDVATANNSMDAMNKMKSMAPDLIILDYLEDRKMFMEILKQKKKDRNTTNAPVVIFSQEMEQKQLLELVPYNVKKVFTKPVKIDALFATLSDLLDITFKLDDSPGIMEIHVNEGIIFVEIAQGLNTDKMDLLRFKISELIALYRIRVPKVIVMLSDTKLGPPDTMKLHKLMFTVLDAAKTSKSYIRVLTNDEFIHRFIDTEEDYKGITVASSLLHAINGLLAAIDRETHEGRDKAERIGDIMSRGKITEDEGDMVFKFDSDDKKLSSELFKDSLENMRIAVIDDDFVIQEMIKHIFQVTNAFVYAFSDGEEFLNVVDDHDFDLAFLDINMPKVNGFEVLKALETKNIKYPIIVLSVISQREAMIKAVQMGIKSWLVKPLKPEDVFRKSIEILKSNF